MTRTERALELSTLPEGTMLRIRWQPDAGKRSRKTHQILERTTICRLEAYYLSALKGACVVVVDDDGRNQIIRLDQIIKAARYLGSRDERARAEAKASPAHG